MLWLFVALQSMAPFLHAHAGAMPVDHGGFLHGHPGVSLDAAGHAMASDAHGAEFTAEQGMRLRDTSLDAVADASPVPPMHPLRAAAVRPDAGLPLPPVPVPTPAEHALPYALAPPAA